MSSSVGNSEADQLKAADAESQNKVQAFEEGKEGSHQANDSSMLLQDLSVHLSSTFSSTWP